MGGEDKSTEDKNGGDILTGRGGKYKNSEEDYGMEFHRNEIQRTFQKMMGR